MAAAAIAIAASACTPGATTPKPGAAMGQAIIEPYLKIQSGLANGSIDGLRAKAGSIATAATTLGAPGVRIDMAAVQLTSAADLVEARDRFGALSEALIAYMDGLKLTPPPGVRVAVCPMLNKSWLQEGSTIANPYYGSEMPVCGDFR